MSRRVIHFQRDKYYTACGNHYPEPQYSTDDWNSVTCKTCLREKDGILRVEAFRKEESERIGWWEVYEYSDSSMGYGYGGHIRYTFGKKPSESYGIGVRRTTVEEVREAQDYYENLAEQTRCELIDGELAEIRMKGN